MKKMKLWVYMILIVFIIAVLPSAALAEDAEASGIIFLGKELSGDGYYFEDNGHLLCSDEVPEGRGYLHLNGSTLTLHDFVFQPLAYEIASIVDAGSLRPEEVVLVVNGSVELVLEGNNTFGSEDELFPGGIVLPESGSAITISGNGSMRIFTSGYGIYGPGSVTMRSGSVELIQTEITNDMDKEYFVGSFTQSGGNYSSVIKGFYGVALKTDNLQLSGGTLDLYSNESGLECDVSMNISGGTLNIISDYFALVFGNERFSGTDMAISGGTVNVSTINGDEPYISAGILVRGGVQTVISGGSVNIAPEFSMGLVAINPDASLMVSGGSHEIGAYNNAIAFMGMIEFTGGTTHAFVTSGEVDASAILSNTGLSLSGKSVFKDPAQRVYGVYNERETEPIEPGPAVTEERVYGSNDRMFLFTSKLIETGYGTEDYAWSVFNKELSLDTTREEAQTEIAYDVTITENVDTNPKTGTAMRSFLILVQAAALAVLAVTVRKIRSLQGR